MGVVWWGGFLKETNALNKSPPEGPDTENQYGKDKKRKKKKKMYKTRLMLCVGVVFFFLFLFFLLLLLSLFGEVCIHL